MNKHRRASEESMLELRRIDRMMRQHKKEAKIINIQNKLQKLGITANKEDMEDIKKGVGSYLKIQKQNPKNIQPMERNLFDKFVSNDTPAAHQLSRMIRTRDDVKMNKGEFEDMNKRTLMVHDTYTGKPHIPGFEKEDADINESQRINRFNKTDPHYTFNRIYDIEHGRNRRVIKKIQAKLELLTAASLPQVHQVIRAFHDKKPLKGNHHETDGKSYFLYKHKIAEHSKHGLKVSNAGYDTPTTYNTLKKIGVGVDVKEGVVHIDNQPYPEKEHGNFLTVPYHHVKDLQPHEIRSIDNKSRMDRGNFNDNEGIQKLRDFGRVVKQHIPSTEMLKNKKEHGTNKPNEIGLSETAIQPEHQKIINKITGVKSKIPKETLGTRAHHILYKERFPGLATNTNNGIALSNKEHVELHRLNPHSVQGGKIEELQTKLQRLAIIKDEDLKEESEAPYNVQSFLNPKGNFISGGYSHMHKYTDLSGTEKEAGFRTTHTDIMKKIEPRYNDVDDFMKSTGHVRVGDVPSERYIQVNSPINHIQLRKIKQLHDEGKNMDKSVEMEIGSGNYHDHTSKSFNNYKDFVGGLRERNFHPTQNLKSKLQKLAEFDDDYHPETGTYIGNKPKTPEQRLDYLFMHNIEARSPEEIYHIQKYIDTGEKITPPKPKRSEFKKIISAKEIEEKISTLQEVKPLRIIFEGKGYNYLGKMYMGSINEDHKNHLNDLNERVIELENKTAKTIRNIKITTNVSDETCIIDHPSEIPPNQIMNARLVFSGSVIPTELKLKILYK